MITAQPGNCVQSYIQTGWIDILSSSPHMFWEISPKYKTNNRCDTGSATGPAISSGCAQGYQAVINSTPPSVSPFLIVVDATTGKYQYAYVADPRPLG